MEFNEKSESERGRQVEKKGVLSDVNEEKIEKTKKRRGIE